MSEYEVTPLYPGTLQPAACPLLWHQRVAAEPAEATSSQTQIKAEQQQQILNWNQPPIKWDHHNTSTGQLKIYTAPVRGLHTLTEYMDAFISDATQLQRFFINKNLVHKFDFIVDFQIYTGLNTTYQGWTSYARSDLNRFFFFLLYFPKDKL